MNIIWVSPLGNDGTADGSRTLPYLTIDAALVAVFVSGDQIRLEEGTYTPAGTTVFAGVDGSLFSEVPGGAIIDPVTITDDNACVSITRSNRFLIQGVKVTYTGTVSSDIYGIYMNAVSDTKCAFCTVYGLYALRNDAYGIYGNGTGRVIGCEVYDLSSSSLIRGIKVNVMNPIDCDVHDLVGDPNTCDVIGIEHACARNSAPTVVRAVVVTMVPPP